MASKTIAFSHIEIVAFPAVIGDHPACAIGPPLQLSRQEQKRTVMDLDSYEVNRPPRRRTRDLVLSSAARIRMLRDNGFSSTEIHRACWGCQRTRETRTEERSLEEHKSLVDHRRQIALRKVMKRIDQLATRLDHLSSSLEECDHPPSHILVICDRRRNKMVTTSARCA